MQILIECTVQELNILVETIYYFILTKILMQTSFLTHHCWMSASTFLE